MVTAERSNQPLSGVQIEVVGTTRGALTNAEGRYLITAVPPGQYQVRTTMLGYSREQTEVTVGAGETATADFTLQTSAIEMSEIVVTGTPGAQTKRELGNSIGKVNVDERLEIAPINHATELLTARTPGLTLMANSGQTGSSSNIRIRGAGSLSGGYQPVFYVDGVRIESGNMEAGSLFQGGTALDFLNPDDIESIEVVKGPAAATLYGADAANGVIQIITKKGRRGGQSAQWTASVGFGEVEWDKSVSGDNYTTYHRCTVDKQNSDTYPGCQIVAGNATPDEIEWWGRDANGNAQLFTGVPG